MPAYRFRPRFRGLALGTIGLGAVLLAMPVLLPVSTAGLTFCLVSGGLGLGLGSLYLASPAWKLRVLTDEDGFEVVSGRGERKLRVAWAEARVIASPSTRTCFIDSGDPATSLLVPGPGATAPYDIADKAALYDEIVTRVAADRITEVELLERASLAALPGAPADGARADADADGNDDEGKGDGEQVAAGSGRGKPVR